MQISISANKLECSQNAAIKAAELLREAIRLKGEAVFVAATGASQFDFLAALVDAKDIPWEKTTLFHLDEYAGLPETHPASFRRYLKERLVKYIHAGAANWIQGDAGDLQAECERLNQLIGACPVDVAFVGIGENGHLAFNDPPADFEVEAAYILVNLDEACRRQQLGEGWFASLQDVPHQAISMSVRQIMKAKAVVCTVPDRRKAQAVHDCLGGEVSPAHPASILRQHPQAFIYLDPDSAALLDHPLPSKI